MANSSIFDRDSTGVISPYDDSGAALSAECSAELQTFKNTVYLVMNADGFSLQHMYQSKYVSPPFDDLFYAS